MAKASIVIVEDDLRAGEILKDVLEAENYKVAWATTALRGRGLVEKSPPDLLILDRTLPDKDGLQFCKELRADRRFADIPVLFLTARRSLAEKVVGLRMGGDDYMSKPYSPEELVARVEVLLRRALKQSGPSGALASGPLALDEQTRLVTVSGREIDLTTKEFDLLRAFMERSERVLSRPFLLTHVWGYDADAEIRTKAVDVMIMGLRKKLGKLGSCIESVKNIGYRFRPPKEKA